MVIRSIPAAQFEQAYSDVERFFVSFYERARGRLDPYSLETEILTGERQCYVAVRGEKVVACALSTVALSGAISLDFCAGDDDEEWPEEMIGMFEAWRSAEGVPLVVTCRSGWVRRLKMTARGYRETHRVMELG